MKRRMTKQKKQGFLRQGSRKKLLLRGSFNYYLSALKLWLKSQSKHSVFALYVDEKLSQLGKRDRRIAEKRISDTLFEVEIQSEREEPVNRQMMYGSYRNNSYCNVHTTLLQGQSYTEMLNNPLQKYFVIITYLYIRYSIIII